MTAAPRPADSTYPTPRQVSGTQLQLLGLCRAVADDDRLDPQAASTLLDGTDLLLLALVAARQLTAFARTEANRQDCTVDDVLDAMTVAVVEAGANIDDHPEDNQ